MYSKEEIQIMNLDDNYTLLYPFLVKSLIEHFGEQGEKTAREGTRRFGRDRAETLRNKHLNAGVKINMHSLFAVGPDLPPDPRFKRELQELNPEERVSHTLYCPMAEIWKKYGFMEIGRMYCEEFHNACYSSYAYGYTKVNLAKTLTQKEDEYCAFNVVLRPENLPEELKPVCFEQYDPGYAGPSADIPQAYGKSGVSTLFVKLYYHLASTAEEMLGDAGKAAIGEGLKALAHDAARRIQEQAKEQNEPVNREFVDLNYPLALDPEQEPLWSFYTNEGIRELFVNTFYPVFHGELGILKENA